tara:strand:- start:18798 stop:20231 length:1434 start_codon:yes stop_codon:yes gene_type:complete
MDPSNNTQTADVLAEKWAPVLEHTDLPSIEDNYKKNVTAVLLENQEKALLEATPANQAGRGLGLATANSNDNMQGYDPILISLVRRAMPNLMAYDVCGVQPMSGPTGLIFAMKSKYKSQGGTEALFDEAHEGFAGLSGDKTAAQTFSDVVGPGARTGDPLFGGHTAGTAAADQYRARGGMDRTAAEALGDGGAFNQMAFSIERTAVEAKTRALKAEYTTELAQDLKAVHGLDAETELANILSTEILAEINREVIRNIYVGAKLGAQHTDLYHMGSGVTGISGTQANPAGGIYNLNRDSDGRWSAERFRGLLFQIEREANIIAKETRRGKGNFIICSADVASALAMSGFLNLSPALNTNLNVDDTGNTFAGVLNGKMKVYIDPYSGPGISSTAKDYVCVGYKGTSPYDAGMFYCPYVPLQMVRAVGENTFQPKIGFKTRYGMVNNPFVSNSDPSATAAQRANQYYRIFRIDELHGIDG